MDNVDVVIVTYNSENWVNNCLCSLLESDYDNKKLFVTFVDNNSQDKTLDIIRNFDRKESFGGYQCICADDNKGFGSASNLGVKNSHQSHILLLNVDTIIHREALSILQKEVLNSSEDVVMWELRQFPYEHPKLYNPITMETSWCSAAACLVRRDAFEQCGGFDESIFMYAEDVDLSWRIRNNGFKLKYVPKSIVYHYTYMTQKEVKPTQFTYSLINNLRLRYKFGSLRDVISGFFWYTVVSIFRSPPNTGVRKRLLKELFLNIILGWKVRYLRNTAQYRKKFKPTFYKFDYEIMRAGAFYINQLPESNPLISVLIRTIGRPNVLREALKSVANQTYNNIQVIIVEDGSNISESMVRKEFGNMNVRYISTNNRLGRSKIANIAMNAASGEYLTFLDDDDLLFADHIEVLCSSLINNKSYQIAYSLAFEMKTEVVPTSPCYNYYKKSLRVVYNELFNRYVLLNYNYLPIQSVMFSKKVFDEMGGIDESLDYLEDWDLWLRYASKYDFLFVEKVTSTYKVPSDQKDYLKRKKLLEDAHNFLKEKHRKTKIIFTVDELFMGMARIRKTRNVFFKLRRKSLRDINHYIFMKLFIMVKKIFRN